MPEVKVKRSDFATFMKTAETSGQTPTITWSRMGKGITSQKISYNPTTTSETYINEETASNSVDSYAPTLDAPQTCYAGDAVFDFVDDIRQRRATGADAETDVLLVYIYDSTTEGQTVSYAAEKQKVSIQIDDFGGDGGGSNVINYTLNFIGNSTKGTCTISNGVPTFTAST